MSDVSAVVCTHRVERWPWLLECLASLERQTLRPGEVIVVVDGSPQIKARLTERRGPEITLSTPRPSGLSAARNLGLAYACGRFVAFLDDDAVAAESWLETLLAVLDDETVAGVGGVSLPRWEGHPPPWMPEELLWTLGCSYRGMPQTRSDVRNVYGGSACFRKEIFTRFGGFNPDLGRKSMGLGGCEETELCLRVRHRSRELRFVHEPGAVIYHRVPPERQKVSYMLARGLGEGRSKAILRAAIRRSSGHALAREANYLIRTVPAGIVANLGRFFGGDGWGLVRAVLLAAEVISTVAAYEVTRIRGLLGRHRARPVPPVITGYRPVTRLSRFDRGAGCK
jgi:glucosyl-dolichyl phosphate glucuronosyltransferase